MSDHRQGTVVVSALLLLSLHVWAVDAHAKKAVLGSLIAAAGQVQVDKVVGIPGSALMEGDVVETGSKSGAEIDLRSGTKVTVGERTELALPYGALPARLDLREGAVAVETGPGQVSQLNTKFATSVVLRSEDGFPALCRVAVVGSEVGILSEKGRVEVHGSGAPFLLPPGKYAVLKAGTPQAGPETAGKVVAAIPTEVVERRGAAALPLKVSDLVYWQDLVKTEKDGRVRIELTGGSLLNIGVRSQMRIIKHDAATGQTELELSAGRLREQVIKLTKPGAHFQTKTQTAVIGVVGTDVLVVSNGDSTTVYCVDGRTKVCSSKPPRSGCSHSQVGQSTTPCPGCANSQDGQSTAHCPCCANSQNGQPTRRCCPTSQDNQSKDSCPCCVILLPGQFTTVPANGAPTPPAPFSPETLQAELSEVSTQPVVSAGQAGYWTILQAGVGSATLGALGVTLSNLGNGPDAVACAQQTYLPENSVAVPSPANCPP